MPLRSITVVNRLEELPFRFVPMGSNFNAGNNRGKYLIRMVILENYARDLNKYY